MWMLQMLSAYDSFGYPNRGSNDPFPLLFIVLVIMVFALGCYCGWGLRRVGQIRVGEIIGKIFGIKLR